MGKFKLKLEQGHTEVPPIIQSVLNFRPPKMLSKIYKTLANIDFYFWRTICLNTFSMIKQPNLQSILFKVLRRTNYTRQRMFQMGMAAYQTCLQCTTNDIDNYLHAFWYCSPVDKFWHMVWSFNADWSHHHSHSFLLSSWGTSPISSHIRKNLAHSSPPYV